VDDVTASDATRDHSNDGRLQSVAIVLSLYRRSSSDKSFAHDYSDLRSIAIVVCQKYPIADPGCHNSQPDI
jgi:hypothetical protein